MGKILALDLGDQWIGTALSDATKLLARPHETISASELMHYLKNLFSTERIDEIIVGYPKTLKGTKSEQTIKVETTFTKLTETFPDKIFKLWDERMTSKQADKLGSGHDKKTKLASHSRAAAFILDSYLGYYQFAQKKDGL